MVMPANQLSSNLSIPYPDPEVPEKPVRRQFTADYKLRLINECDRAQELGQVGAILRREGLYSSHLTTWRRQRERGELEGLSDNKRGRPSQSNKELRTENDKLKRENQRLAQKLKQTEILVEIQKKTSELLGISLNQDENEQSD